MKTARIILIFILYFAVEAQDLNFKFSSKISFGNRVTGWLDNFKSETQSILHSISIVGDRFLHISHRMTPFFRVGSNYSVAFDYNGGDKIYNITSFEITSYGVSDIIWN